MKPQPIYTAENCRFAHHLDWGLSLFWRLDPPADDWLSELTLACEPDGIRILRHRFSRPRLSLFLLDTLPEVAPVVIPARVKGRLQHLIRAQHPKAFQRNYSLRSIGSTRREKIERYIAGQLRHHRMADPRVQQRLARYQIHRPGVDLSRARFTSHGQFWYNLHVVIVNAERWNEIRDEILTALREMLLRASDAKGHLLSEAGILPDHVHLALGCSLEESPQDVGLSYLNNLAYVYGMRRVFQAGCFLETFGEYDLGAVR